MRFLGFFRDAPPPLVQRSLNDLHGMLGTTSRMFEAATACLLEGQSLTLDLKEEDQQVNEKEEQVRRALLTHFSVAPSEDVAFALTLNAIVQEVERMGDLAKSIAKVAQLARSTPAADLTDPLRSIRERVLGMARDTQRALDASDAEVARGV
ncbi:MAG: PhoU domain-containing protein, partial [Rhodothermales bacterium]|nr:PhoU domain-containing protein [Rhodothermales bacterium]